MEHKKHKLGLFKMINPLNGLKMLNPMHSINMIKKGVHGINDLRHHRKPNFFFEGSNQERMFSPSMERQMHNNGSHDGKHRYFDVALAEKAQHKILEKAVPFMKEHLTKHGITKHHENPVHLAGQVQMVREGYERDFQKKIRPKFFTQMEFDNFINSPDYEHQYEAYENEIEKGKGFLGFDASIGSNDEHGFLPLIAVAGTLLKNKKVQAVIKGVGKKVVGAVSKKAKEKYTAQKLTEKGKKSTAQADAIMNGVPPAVVAQHTAGLSPDKASIVAKDLSDVYSSANGTTSAKVATDLGEATPHSNVMMYVVLAVALVGGIGLFVALKK